MKKERKERYFYSAIHENLWANFTAQFDGFHWTVDRINGNVLHLTTLNKDLANQYNMKKCSENRWGIFAGIDICEQLNVTILENNDIGPMKHFVLTKKEFLELFKQYQINRQAS